MLIDDLSLVNIVCGVVDFALRLLGSKLDAQRTYSEYLLSLLEHTVRCTQVFGKSINN